MSETEQPPLGQEGGPVSGTGESQRIVLVTGPSGAGRSTTISTLEDLGYETIDNLPLSLVPRLLSAPHWAAARARC